MQEKIIKNYYEILKIEPDSTAVDIKKAAQVGVANVKIAFRNKDYKFLGFAIEVDDAILKSQAESSLKDIKQAYSILLNPEKRKIYDAELKKVEIARTEEEKKIREENEKIEKAKEEREKIRKEKKRKNKITAIFFLIVVCGFVFHSLYKSNLQEKQRIALAEQRKAEQRKKDYFYKNKATILKDIKNFMEAKNYSEAIAYINPHLITNDPELKALREEALTLANQQKAELAEQARRQKAELAEQARRQKAELEKKEQERRAKEKEEFEKENQAFDACMNGIRKRVSFPSTINFRWFLGSEARVFNNGNSFIVKIHFDAKNALGNELPYTSVCLVENGVLTGIEITGR